MSKHLQELLELRTDAFIEMEELPIGPARKLAQKRWEILKKVTDEMIQAQQTKQYRRAYGRLAV